MQIKRKWSRGDFVPLGNIDGQGTNFADVLEAMIRRDGFAAADDERSVACQSVTRRDDDVSCVFKHGQTGQAARITDEQGAELFRQTSHHTHNVQCGALFSLPGAGTLGWWAVHVNHGRSVKTLVLSAIEAAMAQSLPEFKLHVKPCVRGDVLREALDRGRLRQVKLTRYEEPNDHTVNTTDRWIAVNEKGKLELKISGDGWLDAGPVRRFLDDRRAENANRLYTFGGMEFTQASVTVDLEDGTRRTYNIEAPEAGHPFSVDLENLEMDADGDPTPASIASALARALHDL